MSKIFTVTFPDIGEGVVEGEVIEWRKKVGEAVRQDEPVVVVMTDKATVELPSPRPGKLAKQYYEPGGMAQKDKPLYDIEIEGQEEQEEEVKKEVSSKEEVQESVSLQKVKKEESKKEKLDLQKTPEGQKKLALPKVRKLAKQLGIPLEEIEGSGKDGRIAPEDLGSHRLKGSNQKITAPSQWHLAGDQELPLIGIKALMAKKMALSKSQIPHFSYFEQVDATRLVQLKKNLKERAQLRGVHLTYMPLLLKAISITIAKHPLLNSSYDAENLKVIIHSKQNIGIAMATSLGLIVPVLKGVEAMDLEKIIIAYDELIQRAQAGKLLPSDMKESTVTLSNFGSENTHGLWATPVINYPEAAILGISRIQAQPIAKNNEVIIRDVLNLSWSFDHRIIDGEAATKISSTFCSLIDNPAALL